jgi:hypothetical protein
VELTGGADLGSVELAGNAELGGVQEATPREPHGARQQHAKGREGRDDHAKVVAAALRRHAYFRTERLPVRMLGPYHYHFFRLATS